ncbi:nuclear transport factor 2 family protein [Labrys sp. La1]|uniref:nuclear transport factor 2 family protein n=1 Tax=Labrys sp. La1 TaxID=3404917 RepID=UPI003EBF4FA4
MSMDDAAAETLASVELRLLAERYAMAVDRGDGALFAAQFTQGGVLVTPAGSFSGRAELATVPEIVRSRYEHTHHAVVGMVPVFDGDRANAQTYCHARHFYRTGARERMCYEMTIRYDDEFERARGRWLLSRRALTVVAETRFSAC